MNQEHARNSSALHVVTKAGCAVCITEGVPVHAAALLSPSPLLPTLTSPAAPLLTCHFDAPCLHPLLPCYTTIPCSPACCPL